MIESPPAGHKALSIGQILDGNMRHKIIVGHTAEDLNRQVHEAEDEGWTAVPQSLQICITDRIHRYAIVMAEDDSSNHAFDPESMG